jgi:hypothetical protein
MLEDARMLSNGGHHVINLTSDFDHHINFWTKKIQAMSRSRCYPSTVAIGNGDVFHGARNWWRQPPRGPGPASAATTTTSLEELVQ